jgi:hypothetical protein
MSEDERVLRARVALEEQQNATMVEDTAHRGLNKQRVRYGMGVQLQHVKSGRFLNVESRAAEADPECRGVSLSSNSQPLGSSSAVFKFMPRSKSQAEGSLCYYGGTFVVESATRRNNFLHASSVVYDQAPNMAGRTVNAAVSSSAATFAASVGSSSSSNSSSRSKITSGEATPPPQPALLLPRCLRTGRTFELNLSPKFATLQAAKRGRFTPEQATKAMCTGKAFRMWHSQSTSFVVGSCDAEKEKANNSSSTTTRRWVPPGYEETSTSAVAAAFANSGPATTSSRRSFSRSNSIGGSFQGGSFLGGSLDPYGGGGGNRPRDLPIHLPYIKVNRNNNTPPPPLNFHCLRLVETIFWDAPLVSPSPSVTVFPCVITRTL